MNALLIILLTLSQSLTPKAKYGLDGTIHLPDNTVTPGIVATTNKAAIVGTSWGKDERHVTHVMKVDVCYAYGVTSGCPGKSFEIDHRVPRCAGGADDKRNLWPQPISEAHLKDWLEDRICADIKAAKLEPEAAQAIFLGNWYTEYKKRKNN